MLRGAHRRFLFCLSTLAVAFALFGFAGWLGVWRPSLIRSSVPSFNVVDATEMDSLASVGRVVDTPSCTIPDFDPYNPIISPTVLDPSVDLISCNKSWPMLTDIVNGRFIEVNRTLKSDLLVNYCEYEEVS